MGMTSHGYKPPLHLDQCHILTYENAALLPHYTCNTDLVDTNTICINNMLYDCNLSGLKCMYVCILYIYYIMNYFERHKRIFLSTGTSILSMYDYVFFVLYVSLTFC